MSEADWAFVGGLGLGLVFLFVGTMMHRSVVKDLESKLRESQNEHADCQHLLRVECKRTLGLEKELSIVKGASDGQAKTLQRLRGTIGAIREALSEWEGFA